MKFLEEKIKNNWEILLLVLIVTALSVFRKTDVISQEIFATFLASVITIGGFYLVSKQNSNLEKYKFKKTKEIEILNLVSEDYQPLNLNNFYNELIVKVSNNGTRDSLLVHQVARQEVIHKIVSLQTKIRAFFEPARGLVLHDLVGRYAGTLSSYFDIYFNEQNNTYQFDQNGNIVGIINNDRVLNEFVVCTNSYEEIIGEFNILINKK